MSKEVSKRQKSSSRPGEGESSPPPEAKPALAGLSGKKSPPWEKEAEMDSAGFGNWLRRQREAREISLRDIAERTKIGIRYLEALEEDRFDILPAPVFTKGFLREYARYVGLSADEVINHYLAAHSQEIAEQTDAGRAKAKARERAASSGRWSVLFFVLAAALLLLLLGVFSWKVERRREAPASLASRPPIAAPVAEKAPPPPAAAPVAPQVAPLELNLEFTGDCWTDRSVDGGSHTSETRVKGETLRIVAQKSIVISLGNAPGVKATINGIPLPLPLKKGETIVHDFKIDAEKVDAWKRQKETH